MRTYPFITVAAACTSLASIAVGSEVANNPAGAGTIERITASFDKLVAPDAVIEKIAAGFKFVEGPVWVADEGGGYLLFSDIPANRVLKWSAGEGVSVFLEPVTPLSVAVGPEPGSNGLTLDAAGRLVLCEHGTRRVARLERDSARITLVERYEGKRLNSPNDAVYHSDGSLYFTDPPYGLPEQDSDPTKELDWNGIYRLAPNGDIQLLARQTRPNGIGLSPDERMLYVANSDRAERVWMAYPVKRDGTLGKGTVFYDASSSDQRGIPDGLKVDTLGNVWATGPGGVWVFDRAGKHLGSIKTPELPANVGFGDDGKTLYITAVTGLYRIRVLVPGLMLGPRATGNKRNES